MNGPLRVPAKDFTNDNHYADTPIYSGDPNTRGSEIWTSLDFKWSKRGWVAYGLNFEWDLKSRCPTIWNLDKWAPFCQKPFEIWTKTSGFQMFQFLNGWAYSHSEIPTIWKPDHWKSDLQKVWISNVSRFWMFGFQIPTVPKILEHANSGLSLVLILNGLTNHVDKTIHIPIWICIWLFQTG